MRADLLAKAQESIAFNTVAADNINSKLAEIDERLFAFAYYTPVPLCDTSAHACFYLAILNMYSLIWDCGPMLNSFLWDMRGLRNASNPKFTSLLPDCKKLENVQRIIEYIRSDICHNNYPGYPLNADSYHKHKAFLNLHTESAPGKPTFSENIWENICISFLDMCHDFYVVYIQISEQVKNFPAAQQATFVEKWLSYTEGWYKRNLDISLNVLAELYPLSLSQKGKSPRKINKATIYKWIAENTQKNKGNNKESCLDSIKDILNKDLENKLKEASCPTPALPRPVLFSIFKPIVLYY